MKNILLFLVLAFSFTFMNGQKIIIDSQVTMLALGDSYTIGETVSINERWPHQLIAEFRALGVAAEYPDYIATTGWTTGNLIQGIQSLLDEKKNYNLVSILIGVNNQYQGIDILSYEPDLRKIINRALEITGQDISRVFILSIPDYAYTPFGAGRTNISEQIDAYNIIKKRVADEYGIAYIDVTSISRMGLSDPSLVASDGLHPSGKQYGEWVKEIMPRLSVDPSVSMSEQHFPDGIQLKVYPNPTGTKIYVDSPLDIDRIRLINTQGGLVVDLAVTALPQKIDLRSLTPGIYTLWATRKNEVYPHLYKSICIQPG